MKLLRTKIWHWRDIWMLKWCAFLFGIAGGAYFHECIRQYVWLVLAAAVVLAIRPAVVYFRDDPDP